MKFQKHTPIDVRLLADDRVQMLTRVRYLFSNGLIIDVPARYICDLASVPWLVRGLLPSKVKSSAGAVLHDRCYSHAEEVQEQIRATQPQFSDFVMDRWVADGLARLVWDATPDMKLYDWIYWAGVRIGGGRAWRKHREARARA